MRPIVAASYMFGRAGLFMVLAVSAWPLDALHFLGVVGCVFAIWVHHEMAMRASLSSGPAREKKP